MTAETNELAIYAHELSVGDILEISSSRYQVVEVEVRGFRQVVAMVTHVGGTRRYLFSIDPGFRLVIWRTRG